MSNLKCIERLNILLEENFRTAGICKRASETLENPKFKKYFQKVAAQRNQFVTEIIQQIKDLEGEVGLKRSPQLFRKRNKNISEERSYWQIKGCLKSNKQSLKEYSKALAQVNNGFVREILLRHKSLLEMTISEMKYLKTIVASGYQEKENI